MGALRNEVRRWLDLLHASMVGALQQKADHKALKEIVKRMNDVGGLTGESFAMLAKRGLVGRCASCEAPINVEQKPSGLSLERNYLGPQVVNRPATQGIVSSAPQAGGAQFAVSVRKLPQIGNASAARGVFIPQAKALRTASSA